MSSRPKLTNSAKVNAQVVASFLVMIAGIAGFVWTVQVAPDRERLANSPVTMMLVMAPALVAMFGFVLFVLRLSYGYTLPLPPNIAFVDFHRRKLRGRLKWGGLALLLPLCAVPFQGFGWTGAAFFGVVLWTTAGLIFLAASAEAARLDRGLSLVVADPWVHWQPSAAPLESGAADIFLGSDGLFCNGQYTAWRLFRNRLTEAAVLTDPPRLGFRFIRYSRYGNRIIDRLFPIPADASADLKFLEEKLRAQCPNADIDFTRKPLTK